MDHFIAVLGRRGHAMYLDCRPAASGVYPTIHLPMPDGYRVLIVHTGVRHQNAKGEFNQRVAACRAGVALLAQAYPGITHLRDVHDLPWAVLEPHLPERVTVSELGQHGIDLGDLPGLAPDDVLKVRARCRHVWSENRRVGAAVAALNSGDITTLGALLDAAHVSAREDYEVSCPELEALIAAAHEVEGVVGARLTGAGWGGCIVALVPRGLEEAFRAHVSRVYTEKTARRCQIFACSAGQGAGLVCRVAPEEES
jgi:galactokinase